MKVRTMLFALILVIALFIGFSLIFRDSELRRFTNDFSGFTDEIVTRLQSENPDDFDNVQRLIDERKDVLSERLATLTKRINGDSKEEEQLIDSLEKNSANFEAAFTAKIKTNPAIKNNPILKEKLRKLLGDYSSIVNRNS